MEEVVIVSAVRTAIGAFGGALKSILPVDLSRFIIEEVIQRSTLDPGSIDKVIFGNCFSPLDSNIARIAAFQAGIPQESPAFTINSTCGSSLQAIICAVQSIYCQECDVILAGGVESMSNAPYIQESTRWGQRMQHTQLYDLVWKAMQEYPIGVGMGLTAENISEKYNISREEQDAFALISHQRATQAIDKGKFLKEILPISVKKGRNEVISFQTDEHVRKDITIEKLAKLNPVFKKNGTVTAGNACGMNDASSAIILMSRSKANKMNIKPLATIKGYHVAGVDPHIMGIGPVPAIQNLLKKTQLNVNDIDRFEINEAFAAQYLACERDLSLDREKVNVNGSGIALGHPVGATGCRILVSLIYNLIADDKQLGIASLCAGGGMGFAIMIERE